MENKLISIIMPLYNCEKYIEEAIRSVINQDYQNWELLICDDCSTDNSFNIATSFSKNDKRIKVFKNKVNSGTAFTRNTCLKEAKGEYIAFLDSDDFYFSNFLSEQLNFIEKNNYYFVCCSFTRLADNSNSIYKVPKRASRRRIMRGSCLSTMCVFIKKTLINDTKFDTDCDVEDFLFFLELLKKCKYVYGNRQILSTYRIIKSSKSRNKKQLAIKMWHIYRKKLNLNILSATFYFCCWAIHGVYKYRKIK